MGDCTWASITYPAWAEPLIAAHFGETDIARFWGEKRQTYYEEEAGDIDVTVEPATTFIGKCECNYGEHPLQKVLAALACIGHRFDGLGVFGRF